MARNLAARAGGLNIKPVFLSIALPSIEDGVAELAEEGVNLVYLLPYFLHDGKHVTVDIPEVVEKCHRDYPDIRIEMMPTLQNEPMMAEIVLERLKACMK